MTNSVQELLNPNKTIYFPALSSGESKSWLTKQVPALKNGMTPRFYDESWPEYARHRYFLVSAGHNYKKEIRKTMGLEDCLVIGDSGGYQISTGILQWDSAGKLRQALFEWLENNSDFAVNIDIPPVRKYSARFEESMRLSIDNFRYFEENQTGKTRYLNVIQGSNEDQIQYWYKNVKGMNFNGWSIGSARQLVNLLFKITVFLENGEFENPKNQLFHILGVSRLDYFFVAALLQKAINEKYKNNIVISSDSSSANLYSIYGQLLTTFDLRSMSFSAMGFTNQREVKYNPDALIPSINSIRSHIYDGVTMKDLYEWNQFSKTFLTLANLQVILDLHRLSNDMVFGSDDLLTAFSADYQVIFNSINELVASDNPRAVFMKYKSLYEKYSNFHDKHQEDLKESFFEF